MLNGRYNLLGIPDSMSLEYRFENPGVMELRTLKRYKILSRGRNHLIRGETGYFGERILHEFRRNDVSTHKLSLWLFSCG